jgi:peptide-methionine (R)-S-oxide reductase
MNKPSRSASGYDLTPLSPAAREALAARLSPEERRILLHQGTEPPFCGGLLQEKRQGVFTCRLCGLPLFRSSAKFESGTGWPSFHTPFDEDHIRYLRDESHGMVRTEIRCARCDGHLGHVFDDGPAPTGLRYCLNSASLEFLEGDAPPAAPG